MQNMFRGSVVNTNFSRWDVSDVLDIRWMFYESILGPGVEGSTKEWKFKDNAKLASIFSQWDDSPLGYLGLLQGDYSFPKEDARRSAVESLVSFVQALNVCPMDAAYLIFGKMHHPNIEGPSLENVPYLGMNV